MRSELVPSCPYDGMRCIYYNKHFGTWRCAWCESSFDEPVHLPPLMNPLLLLAKGFLADIRPWWREYRESSTRDPGYVCRHFAKEVFKAATRSRIRCGFATVSFEGTHIGHAIVAFQTDYGLKYFEPQNGNEVDVVVGRVYRGDAEGVSELAIISDVAITWNDDL